MSCGACTSVSELNYDECTSVSGFHFVHSKVCAGGVLGYSLNV